MNNKQLTIGLFGFGVVGKGLYDVLHRTAGLQSTIQHICVLNKNKQRSLPSDRFTYNKWDILDDDSVNVVVELINDAAAAYEIVTEAMKRGKSVVTANKAMVATYLAELLELQQQTGVSLLYEASTCGSIPIIRNLEEYYDNDLLSGVDGIVNGTTNYILTKLTEQPGISYSSVVADAQRLGFAELDPTLDVEGWDAAYKTCIIAAHAFGVVVDPKTVLRRGITSITPFDLSIAQQYNSVVKLISNVHATEQGISTRVLPTFVKKNSQLSLVNNEVNAVRLLGAFSDAQVLVGKGAGAYPTASAVLSDIAALRYDYHYEYKKLHQISGTRKVAITIDEEITIYVRAEAELLHLVPWRSIQVDHRSQLGSYIIGTVGTNELRACQTFADIRACVAVVTEVQA